MIQSLFDIGTAIACLGAIIVFKAFDKAFFEPFSVKLWHKTIVPNMPDIFDAIDPEIGELIDAGDPEGVQDLIIEALNEKIEGFKNRTPAQKEKAVKLVASQFSPINGADHVKKLAEEF